MSNNVLMDMGSVIPTPKMTYPKPQVHAQHPFKDVKNHQLLMDYVMPRVAQGFRVTHGQLERYATIDKEVSGWMRLSEDDRARRRKQQQTGIPQATLTNLPLTYVHLDDLVTYYTQTFAPGKAMFYHTGKPDETEPASQMVLLMNNHAVYTGFYRHLYQGCWAMLKYNLGGFRMGWETEYGPKFAATPDNKVDVTNEAVWSGNKAHACDMYNTIMDPSVHPVMVHKDGEYAGYVAIRSHYWLSQRAMTSTYFNLDEELNNSATSGMNTTIFYRHPPAEAEMDSDESTSSNWITKLSDSPIGADRNGYEILEVDIRLNPTQFGLVESNQRTERDRYEIWRLTFLSNKRLIGASRLNNVHNHIAYYFGMVNDDGMERQQKSTAEIMSPFQNFASHVMNIHIQATRKKLFGLTCYDPSVIDLSQIPEGEIVGFVPAIKTGMGKNLNEAIWQDRGDIDTEKSLEDLKAIMDIVNIFFPVQALPSQIAGMDRAVSGQVQAVQQGVNRRMQKSATLLDSTCLRPLRFGLYYNILQYQADAVEITDFRGRTVTVNLSELRMTDLPFIIGMGLKAIDRQMVADRLQQVIFALIQNPNSAAQINVLGLIDFWTDMLDIDLDMNQFKLAPPPAPASPDGEAEAGATPAAGVQPATNPAAMTGPILDRGVR